MTGGIVREINSICAGIAGLVIIGIRYPGIIVSSENMLEILNKCYLRDIAPGRVELDELWTFIQKQKLSC
ncbi:hypothetical protein [Methanoregula sp.]|uniref:hypothetical protein n=1 Tax=Methanoregula sp. TaxID=2052170 RepID=UPI003563B8D9